MGFAASFAPIASIAMVLSGVQAIAATVDRPDFGDAIVVAAADMPRPQLEVTASTLPRFDNVDANTQTNRIDMRLQLSPDFRVCARATYNEQFIDLAQE